MASKKTEEVAEVAKKTKTRGPLVENKSEQCWMSITAADARAIELNPEKLTGAEVIAIVRERVGIPKREREFGRSSAVKRIAESVDMDAELLTLKARNAVLEANPDIAQAMAEAIKALPKH